MKEFGKSGESRCSNLLTKYHGLIWARVRATNKVVATTGATNRDDGWRKCLVRRTQYRVCHPSHTRYELAKFEQRCSPVPLYPG